MGRIRLAVFDMAGTTVDDVIDGVPLVLRSYDDAFRRHGVVVPMEVLNEQRGRDKRTVIEEFGGGKAPQIYEDFLRTLMENTGRVREVDGASGVFRFLKEHGVAVALSTGFPREVAEGILEHLGWVDSGPVDYWVCSETVGASRPDPAMIRAAMRHFGIDDPRSVVKVDDTAKGVEEGLNAGAITIGVLTGTQGRERLESAGAAAVLKSVRELPPYLEERGLV